METKVLHQDNMIIEVDVPCTMSDGTVLRCDIYRPEDESKKYPVIFSLGPYGKGINLLESETYIGFWTRFVDEDPTCEHQTSNKYQNWEVVDPELWTKEYGYACVRFDSRGAGSSEGYFCPFDLRQEAADIYECMDWLATLPWCDGNMGMSGISYYAINQYAAAAFQPSPHLKAICPYEAFIDQYRDVNRTGGIYSRMFANWLVKQGVPVQHGQGDHGYKHMLTGENGCGDETWTEEELAANCVNLEKEQLDAVLDSDPYYVNRHINPEDIKVPMLIGCNWAGAGVHPRGAYEAFTQASSKDIWLEIHPGTHGTMYVNPYGEALQKMFFDHFVKGIDNGWEKMPKVMIWRCFADKPWSFDLDYEEDWPLPQQKLVPMYCTMDGRLTAEKPEKTGTLDFQALGQGLTFITEPLPQDVEILGPIESTMRISSSTTDADIFVVLRVFSADLHESYRPGQDTLHPMANGWLRASQRKVDPDKRAYGRPWHPHDEIWPLEPGEPVDLDIEIVPTGYVIPKGYRIAFTIRGKDYERDLGEHGDINAVFVEPMNGVGPAIHVSEEDRPVEIFGGTTTLYFDEDNMPTVILPFIPRDKYYPDAYAPDDYYFDVTYKLKKGEDKE